MKEFFEKAAMQDHPLRALQTFLERERSNKEAKKYDDMRFVGYVLDIGYETTTIITSDPYKIAVGGVPRNSLLIMVPSNFDSFPPHFTLLRVLEAAPTPLTKEVQQTYFELQKRSMPELDIFTQSELQWGALKTGVLGMFYPHAESLNEVEFSGDLNNFVSAHKYRVYAPDEDLLELITNTMVPADDRFALGKLRLTECRLPLPDKPFPDVDVFISATDFKATRTVMFGKTRLGKSNVVKLIAESLIKTTKEKKNVGQLIFDIDGEYANDNPQDDSCSLKSIYPEDCVVYALTEKEKTESKPLRLDFYEHPESSHNIIGTLLREAGKSASNYVESFLAVDIPSPESLGELPPDLEKRARRKILMYWSILYRAGYTFEQEKLKRLVRLSPHINRAVRLKIYRTTDESKLPSISSISEVADEFERCAELDRDAKLKSSSGKDLFDADDLALLGFLRPVSRAATGPRLIQAYRKYHDSKAGDFVEEIIHLLDAGQTVILDMGNAPPEVLTYFSVYLSRAIFYHQVDKFSNNKLGNHYVQLYFEEAHNLFPRKEDAPTIYSRFAKEGAKYHIGMVYSTQSPTTVNRDLLAQTENFFIAHLSSQDDVNALAKTNVAYESMKDDILKAKTVGYIRMLTRSHRFVISVQARKFTPSTSVKNDK